MASYWKGIEWIAFNDEPDDLDPENVEGYISTQLLAHVVGRDPATVAGDVVIERVRTKLGYTSFSKQEQAAWHAGFTMAIHSGLRGYNPYKLGKVFGHDLHRSWGLGYDDGQELLRQNNRMEVS